MERWRVRLGVFVEEYTWVVVAGALVLGLLGGFVTYQTYVDPGEEVQTVEESSWTTTTAYTHEATVVEDTEVFAAGEVLEGQSVYFERIAPVLNGTFSYEYEATAGGSVDVTTAQTLVLQASGEEDDVYWRDERPLGSPAEQTVEGVEPGERVTASFAVNVTQVQTDIDEIEAQLGASPGDVEVLVVTELSVSGEKNAIPYDETLTHELSIEPAGTTYSVAGAGPQEDSEQQFGERTETTTYGPLRTVGGPALLFAGVLGLAGVAVGRWSGWLRVDDRDRAWAEYLANEREYDEWITTGAVPAAAISQPLVEVDSLEGLVDVAIDSNRRVIDTGRRYVVLLEETTYVFDPPPAPQEGPLLGTSGDGATPTEASPDADETATREQEDAATTETTTKQDDESATE